MKKKVTIAAIALTVAFAVPAIAFAAQGWQLGSGNAFDATSQDVAPQAVVSASCYIDNNGDGICDNRQSGTGSGCVDVDNDGVCDNRQSGTCYNGNGYVDADGDGVCDNWSSGGRHYEDGYYDGRHHGGSHHGGGHHRDGHHGDRF